jgi:hypothetical protein
MLHSAKMGYVFGKSYYFHLSLISSDAERTENKYRHITCFNVSQQQKTHYYFMEWAEIPEINLYSDGGAEPNPGKGGFGVIMSYQGIKREFSQGYELTTNNRMELMGVIYGLERLKTKSVVNVFTDSRYVIDGIEKGWAEKWKPKNWFRTRMKWQLTMTCGASF